MATNLRPGPIIALLARSLAGYVAITVVTLWSLLRRARPEESEISAEA